MTAIWTILGSLMAVCQSALSENGELQRLPMILVAWLNILTVKHSMRSSLLGTHSLARRGKMQGE